MERRDILKMACMLTGSAMLAPLTSTLVHASIKNQTSAGKAQFFSGTIFSQLKEVMDAILPRTDTPSASDVNTHGIMDSMFANVFDKAYKEKFLARFEVLQEHLNRQSFFGASADKQLAILKAIEKTSSDSKNAVFNAYLDLKQQTISYYLATEEVAENHLNYLPIPMQYIPDISVKEVGGKAWAE